MLGQEAVVKHSSVPPWWSMVVSAWGMTAATFSHYLQLSPALYPGLVMAIMAAPAAAAVKKFQNGNGNGGDR